jgi:hypothetical protein
VKLFGVRIGDKPIIRKAVSMGNLEQFGQRGGGARDEGYGSEGNDDKPNRKRGEILSLSIYVPCLAHQAIRVFNLVSAVAVV